MAKVDIVAAELDLGTRLDVFVAANANIARSQAQKLINNGFVLINNVVVTKSYKICADDKVTIVLPDISETAVLPEKIALEIVYEDEYIVVVNKPKGMVVHPATGNYSGTLVNALLYRYGNGLSDYGGDNRPGIVHRLDKDTSGLLVVAKDNETHEKLSKQFAMQKTLRLYNAVIYGGLKNDSGEVDFPIGRSLKDRKKMAVNVPNAKHALTQYNVISRYYNFTHIQCSLKTGRTHQIRVHMAAIGHPVAGDRVYGPKKVIKELEGQCLHSGTIGFNHPTDGRYLEFSAPLPIYFTRFLQKLESEKRT